MLIQNHKASAIRVGGTGTFTGDTAEGIQGGFVLMPGINEVEAKQLEDARKLVVFRGMEDEGLVEVVDEKIETLARLPESKALKVIRSCYTLELLAEWRKTVKIDKLKKAITAQQKMLEDKLKAAKKAGAGADGAESEEDEEPEA